MRFTETNIFNISFTMPKILGNLTTVNAIPNGITDVMNSQRQENKSNDCNETAGAIVSVTNEENGKNKASFEDNIGLSSKIEEKPAKNSEVQFIIEVDLPNVEVVDIERDKSGHYYITVQSTLCGTNCQKCNGHATCIYQVSRERVLRDLSILGSQVFIKIRPLRYRCKYCKTVSTQQLEWCAPRSSYTLRYEEHILLQLINSTYTDVAKKEGLTYDRVLGIVERNIKSEVDWNEFEKLPVLGIDEIANLKGHREYFAVITARIDGDVKILAVLPDRKKATVKAFIAGIPDRLKITIDTVCTDMNEGYINAVEEELNNGKYSVKIVIDRFHVAKNYRESLEDVRKEEMKRLKAELSEKEYKKLKNVHWTLRKKWENLSKEEEEQLNYLFSLSPKLKEVYDYINDLTEIFDHEKLNAKSGERKINRWIKKVKNSDLIYFDTFIGTLEKHIKRIANYFTDRLSSGFVEGLNNKLKVIKRCSYGLRKTSSFFQRIYLSLEGYRLYG